MNTEGTKEKKSERFYTEAVLRLISVNFLLLNDLEFGILQ